ncbi:MAG: Ig-like domain-containing protein [Methanothrix sp.]
MWIDFLSLQILNIVNFLPKLLILAPNIIYHLNKIWGIIMGVRLEFKVPWAVLKMALLMVLLLTIASGGQEPCSERDGNCNPSWSLLAKDDVAFAQVSDSSENDFANLNAIDTALIAFDFQNQSSSPEVQNVMTGNDTAKIIEFSARDINNDLLSYKFISSPLNGNVSGTAPNIIYKPNKGYLGNDSFIVSATNTMGIEKNISVSIDVVSLSHPPTVRIRSPRNGEIFTAYPGEFGATGYSVEIPIHATSSGDVSSIEFFDETLSGDKMIGSGDCENTGGDCPVTIFYEFSVGTHILTAKAVPGTGGNSCPSLPVIITVNPSQPVVRITSPLAGQIFTSPEDITITAEVIDSNPVSSVEFYANSQKIWSTTESDSPYTFVWEDVKPGVYNIVAKAIEVPDDPFATAVSKPVLIVVVPTKPLSKSDLALSMSSTSNPAPSSGLFNYVLTVTNRGPDSATDVNVQDFLPPELELKSSTVSQGSFDPDPGIWSLGSLTKYHSARLVLTVQVHLDAPPGQVSNTAYVYGAEVDPDNSNNHAITYTKIDASEAPVVDQNSTEVNSTQINSTMV